MDWIVTGTSMLVEDEKTADDAINRAQDMSGWNWEARPIDRANPDRLRSNCGCGVEVIWTPQGWQHDAAPYIWGDDHDVDLPDPSPEHPAVKYWDIMDGVREPDDIIEHEYTEHETQESLRDHLVNSHGAVPGSADVLYNAGDHHLRTMHRMLHREDPEGD
jgi:hypothetical protein